MIWERIDSIESVVAYVASTLATKLGEGPVLWLLSGGSAMEVEVAVADRLGKAEGIIAMLMDERFGPVGHRDSNWQQLIEKGFADKGIAVIPTLGDWDIETTTKKFEHQLISSFRSTKYALGLFGLGADGHTAGILPGSPAVGCEDLAINYRAADFERITITTETIRHLDEVVLYARGESKRQALNDFDREEEWEVMPAQSLWQVPKLTIFNDFRGE
jgi:6-phosphogluconolactonase/glucosamine-6-phosphate isomerase/deaminase